MIGVIIVDSVNVLVDTVSTVDVSTVIEVVISVVTVVSGII